MRSSEGLRFRHKEVLKNRKDLLDFIHGAIEFPKGMKHEKISAALDHMVVQVIMLIQQKISLKTKGTKLQRNYHKDS